MKKSSRVSIKKTSQKLTSSLIFFLVGGFIAGLLALLLTITTNFFLEKFLIWNQVSLWLIALLVFEEELIKFISLNFLFLPTNQKVIKTVLNGILFGLGFGFFEFFLIYSDFYFEINISNNSSALFSIHILTSILVSLSVINFNKKHRIFVLFFGLAFIFHLLYNFVINICIF